MMMSWSDIPDTFVDDLTSVGFYTKTRSSRFSSPVKQTQFITDGELEWVKIKLLKNKYVLVGSFYMPHH
jgi:hypothetical protein